MAKTKPNAGSNKGAKIMLATHSGCSSIGGNPSTIKYSTMNKHKRRGYKPYRGQGRI